MRIGLVNLVDSQVLQALRVLPSQPQTSAFANLYDHIGSILDARPELLVVGTDDSDRDLAGALRLLRGLLPTVPVVVVAPLVREVEFAPICRRSATHLLLTPLRPGALANALELALSDSDRPAPEVFLDLARGFADEVNNPLMFLVGHLQLMMADLVAEDDGGQRDKIRAALDGADRIGNIVEHIRLLARAAEGPVAQQSTDLKAVFRAALDGQEHTEDLPAVVEEPANAEFQATADADLMQEALERFARVGIALQELGCRVHFVWTQMQGGLRLRMQVFGAELANWRLPHSYEPYYLNRLSGDSSHGLSLFLVQTTVHGHGGQATARRMPDGSLALDLQMPTSPPEDVLPG